MTNVAKCTLTDARPLPDMVFRDARELFLRELRALRAHTVVAFGNQVASILLERNIRASVESKGETLILGSDKKCTVYPCPYPVGRQWFNVGKSVQRIKEIQKRFG